MIFIIFFFFNDTATTEIYTLSLHDALPIFGLNVGEAARDHQRSTVPKTMSSEPRIADTSASMWPRVMKSMAERWAKQGARSEEHTSELQSRQYLVCRLLLEKKKKNIFHGCIYKHIIELITMKLLSITVL